MTIYNEINGFKEKLLQDKSNSTVASYAYFPLIGWIIPLFHKRQDNFCQHHAKQGFMLSIYFVLTIISLNIANIFMLNEWYDIRYGIVISIYSVYGLYPVVCFINAILTKKGKQFKFPFVYMLAKHIEI